MEFSGASFSYRLKFFFLLGGCILLGLAVYKKTYRHIFEIRNELSDKDNQQESAVAIYSQLGALTTEINSIDAIIGDGPPGASNEQTRLFEFIINSKIPVEIIRVDDEHQYVEDEYTVFTNQVELEGSYIDLISMLHYLESNFDSSRVVSSRFYSFQNLKTKEFVLRLVINFQNYEKV